MSDSKNEMINSKIYNDVREVLEFARSKTYAAVNFAMVEAYWNIGRLIAEQQGGTERAEYGTALISELSKRLTADYGKGFTQTNLKYMRQFYLQFKNSHALRDQLTWTHYRLIMKVENDNARQFYLDECIKSNWSTRQLERQINSFFYERLLASHNAPNAKAVLAAEIESKEPGASPLDVIKDPYVLEFLGLNHNEYHFETKSIITDRVMKE